MTLPSIFGGYVTVPTHRTAIRIPAPGPVPREICAWYEEHISNQRDDYGQWLYARANTRRGDRQLVWEAGGNKRLVLVVDFATNVVYHNGRYYAFGRVTILETPITGEQLASDPVLNWRFLGTGGAFLAGPPKALDADVVAALTRIVGRWPERALPTGDPTNEPFYTWTGHLDVDIEVVFERAIINDTRLRRSLGFSDAVERQRHISRQSRLDLRDPWPPAFAELKRVLRAKDIDRMERYIDELGPGWRPIFIHGRFLSLAAAQALNHSRYSDRIEVWRLDGLPSGRFKAVRER
jgi:hypothetical protein